MRQVFALISPISILLVVVLMATSGCQRDFSTEADALRERVMVLERELESLEQRNAELRATLRRAARQRENVPEEALAATPQVAGISIGRLSHARIARDEDDFDTLRIYINPVDGRGRFVPLVGTLRLHAVMMPGEGEPITIDRTELSPDEIRDRYRSGFTGTHYTIYLPIDWPAEINIEFARAEPVIVRAIFDDAYTGEQHSAERSLHWREARPRSHRERGSTRDRDRGGSSP